MYGKLIDGEMEYASKNVSYNGKLICNPKEELLRKLGYLPIVLTERESKEGYISVSYWEEEGNQIIQKWRQEEVKEEITLDDRVTALEDAFSEFVDEVMNNG